MTVISSARDLDARSLTIVSEFDAPVERVWQIWADPRQLERWWGPPGFPATVTDHQLAPGGRVNYHMTGPDGAEYPGWWIVREVDAPHLLVTQDGFSGEDGAPDLDMPVSIMRVTLADLGDGRTRMTMVSTWPTLEAMQQTLDMGAEEGMKLAQGQIAGVLAV